MDFTLAGTVLSRDLFAADGRRLASRGETVDLPFLRQVARRARKGGRERPLHETAIADSVLEAFEAEALQHVTGTQEARAQVADAITEVRFPQLVWDELEAMRREDPPRFQHAIWTAVVSARLFRSALGSAPGLARLVGGALTHDIGMRHAGSRLRLKREHLTCEEALALEDHPAMGAVVLAGAVGEAPAVQFALLHHTRSGRGYPRTSGKPPLHGLDLISVASAFAALIAPRPYRAHPFNARGAIDQLCDEAAAGAFDERAVRLLIHCLRGGRGPVPDLHLPRKPTGLRPAVNHHGLAVAAGPSA
jgi:HD-GYP domain-containing protein (c-di-GMP phosphodiesterase class II)